MTAKTESPTDTHDDQQPLAGERTGKDSGRERVATPYPLHPVCADYADFTGAEADAMRESLRKLGRLVTPIALWRDQIVDGRHREMFCRELGIDLRYDDLTDRCPTEEAMRAHVAALNEHRRARTTPLTIKEKRTKVDAALKADPKRSDRAIDEATGTSDPFVAKRRKKLSKKGANVSTPPAQRRSRKGKSGEGQHTEPQPIHQPPAHPAKAAVVVNHPAAAGRPIGDPGPAGAGHPIGDPAVPAVAGENKDAERAADEAFARHLIGLMEMDYASARTVAAYLREHGVHLVDPDIEDDNF